MDKIIEISEHKSVNLNKPVVFAEPLDEIEKRSIYLVLDYTEDTGRVELKPFLIEGRPPEDLIERSTDVASIEDIRNIEKNEFGYGLENYLGEEFAFKCEL